MPIVQECGMTHDEGYIKPTMPSLAFYTALGTKIVDSSARRRKFLARNSKKIQEILSSVTYGFVFVLLATPPAVLANPLSNEDFRKLAAQCAPGVSSATLESVARTESSLNPWILHDNATGQTYSPETLSDAAATLNQWIARGHSIDIGLMQINSVNLGALRTTATTALDPCVSLADGAAILQAAYGGGDTPAEQKVALLMALSRYNTGSPFKGILNGYAEVVMNNLEATTESGLPKENTTILQTDPAGPSTWDVSATGTYVQIHGASWLVDLEPMPERSASFMTSKSR